jgi:hypothetical protein
MLGGGFAALETVVFGGDITGPPRLAHPMRGDGRANIGSGKIQKELVFFRQCGV